MRLIKFMEFEDNAEFVEFQKENTHLRVIDQQMLISSIFKRPDSELDFYNYKIVVTLEEYI